jgi:hypothetical protein
MAWRLSLVAPEHWDSAVALNDKMTGTGRAVLLVLKPAGWCRLFGNRCFSRPSSSRRRSRWPRASPLLLENFTPRCQMGRGILTCLRKNSCSTSSSARAEGFRLEFGPEVHCRPSRTTAAYDAWKYSPTQWTTRRRAISSCAHRLLDPEAGKTTMPDSEVVPASRLATLGA